jgi:hypothetical protein
MSFTDLCKMKCARLEMKWCVIVLIFLASGQIGWAQIFSSSNLPIIVINTNGTAVPNEPKIAADMGIIYNGAGVLNNLTDQYNNYNGKIGIEKAI